MIGWLVFQEQAERLAELLKPTQQCDIVEILLAGAIPMLTKPQQVQKDKHTP